MSAAGIHGVITDGMDQKHPCLVIGDHIPRIHHSDGIPVYLVIESEAGMPVICKNGQERQLLAYPSHWPGPGEYLGHEWLFAYHEQLPWDAAIPCFNGDEKEQ